MIWSNILEIIGLSLAVLDFTDLSRWLEDLLDGVRDAFSRLTVATLDLFFSLLASTWFQRVGLVVGVVVGGILIKQDLSLLQLLQQGFIWGLFIGVALALFFASPFLISLCLWLPFHLMNMAPKGIVGSLGLMVAGASFLMKFF